MIRVLTVFSEFYRSLQSAVQVVQASSFIRRLSLMRKLKSTLTDSQLLAHETEVQQFIHYHYTC